jgi:hypothetical protein
VSALNIDYSPPNHASDKLGIVFGRFMLPDMSEFPCQVVDIGMDGATFMSGAVPPVGQTLVAYLEEIGRIEAISADAVDGGFRIKYTLQGARLKRLQQRINWLRNADENAVDNRRHVRFEPSEKLSHLELPDGRLYTCEVLDISISGAAVKTDVMPSVGTYVMLGKMRGRVVRYLDHGVAIEFVKQLAPSQLPSSVGPPPL